MATLEDFAPATSMFSGVWSTIGKYGWVLLGMVIIFGLIGIIWIWKTVKKKDSQWTHTLKVRRVLQNNLMSDPEIMRMRRFPLIKKAEVFELEKPLLGGYLIPELDQYSGHNEYSIILDKNNRIYTNMGEYFDPSKTSINVSARHAEIDIQRQTLKADFQNINKVSKRIEWATIAKYALILVAIVAFSIVAVSGMTKWGEAQQYKAQAEAAQAQNSANMAEAMLTMAGIVNTQQLLIPELKELKGTNNLQNLIISNKVNATS